jgi:light-regulated signal transduction histidine kinase (bacteriophytochrome)
MQWEAVDLSALAEEVSLTLRQVHPDRRVDVRIQPGLVTRGDSRLLRLAIENLMGNAWKFTIRREIGVIEFGLAENNSERAYFMRDNGAGFDMTYAHRLFAAFQRLHDAKEYPGTGIGLATVQRVINRHGGRVWAESTVDAGAVFYFVLSEGAPPASVDTA